MEFVSRDRLRALTVGAARGFRALEPPTARTWRLKRVIWELARARLACDLKIRADHLGFVGRIGALWGDQRVSWLEIGDRLLMWSRVELVCRSEHRRLLWRFRVAPASLQREPRIEQVYVDGALVVVTMSDSDHATLWLDRASGEIVLRSHLHYVRHGGIDLVRAEPEGELCLWLARDSLVRLGQTERHDRIQWLPGGRLVTWGAGEPQARLWSAQGELLAELDHGSPLVELVGLADGRMVGWGTDAPHTSAHERDLFNFLYRELELPSAIPKVQVLSDTSAFDSSRRFTKQNGLWTYRLWGADGALQAAASPALEALPVVSRISAALRELGALGVDIVALAAVAGLEVIGSEYISVVASHDRYVSKQYPSPMAVRCFAEPRGADSRWELLNSEGGLKAQHELGASIDQVVVSPYGHAALLVGRQVHHFDEHGARLHTIELDDPRQGRAFLLRRGRALLFTDSGMVVFNARGTRVALDELASELDDEILDAQQLSSGEILTRSRDLIRIWSEACEPRDFFSRDDEPPDDHGALREWVVRHNAAGYLDGSLTTARPDPLEEQIRQELLRLLADDG